MSPMGTLLCWEETPMGTPLGPPMDTLLCTPLLGRSLWEHLLCSQSAVGHHHCVARWLLSFIAE